MATRLPGKRWLHGLLTLLLSLSLVSTAFAAPESNQKQPPGQARKAAAISAVEQGKAKAIVEPEVEQALAKGGHQTFLVKLKASADIQGASAAAKGAAQAAGKTPAAQQLAQRVAVIDSLQSVANQSQKGLIAQLEAMKRNGSVQSYQAFWIVNGIAVTGDAKALQAIAARPEVERITPDYEIWALGGPAGSALAPMGVGAVGGSDGGSILATEWNIDRINAPAAWALGVDGTGTVSANLDTGVAGNHPALAHKWRGNDGAGAQYSWFDAVNGQSQPYDDHGHGTHVMGTQVGSEQSGANQVGVAPGSRWIAAKILNASGSGSSANILAAGQWILAPGGDPSKAPDVVNNSWGGGAGVDEWFRPTVQAWRAAQIVPVFANGNTRAGQTECLVSVPANYPESIGVGAVNSSNLIASFSCHGPSPYGEIKPELSAPGVGIRSAVPGGGYEGGWSGTSMAAPHVAGVAALLRDANASLTVDEIEAIMIGTATPLTDSLRTEVPNNWYGWGLVNAFDAVSEVMVGRGTLSGRVSTSGDDMDEPVITHTPVQNAYAGFTVPIEARVTDNVSVLEVNLYARWQGDPYYTIIPMNRVSGDFKDGVYRAEIPGYLVQMPSAQYYIRAVDYGNNPVSTAATTVTVSRGIQPGWSTDLESAPIGWESGGANNPWQWGTPTSGPGSARSGSNVWATNLSGDYANSTNAYLMMPPLDLNETTAAVLEFWHWYNLENNYDWGDIFVSADYGFSWTQVAEFTNVSNGWQKYTLNLTPFAGNTVLVAFNLFSDGSVVRPGWYIDDLALIGPDSDPPAAPMNLTGSADSIGNVTLNWTANTENDLAGYKVFRSATSGSGYALLGSPTANTFVDGTAPQGETSYYVVTARDLWGNESGYSNEVAVTPQGPTVIFFDDFEGDDTGWTTGGNQNQWQRGTPTSGPNAAFSGTKVWATNLAGDYLINANAWLMSPPIAIEDVSDAMLTFAHWYNFENNYDFGYVEISTNGTTWTQLGARFTNLSNGWLQPTYDLSAYIGQTVQIRFRNTSDGSVNRAGWYIDDVKILGTASATVDGAWIPTKPAAKKGDNTPLYVPPKSVKGEYKQAIPGATNIGIMALPVDATITVLETGRSVRTNPANGHYSLSHAAGSYTVRAEAYGYFPVDHAVTITDGGSTTRNFFLQPIPMGTVYGTVTNSRTGDPIAGATIRQVEDARIGAVQSDAGGNYSLAVLQGTYTVKVSAEGYKTFTTTVTVPGNGGIMLDVELDPFIGFPGELAYDDGTAENAWAYYDPGNGWAVRMTPDPAKGAAKLQSGSVYLWGTDWPTPGGNTFMMAVYDASGPNGAPGQLVAGPVTVTGTRGQWNTVDLSAFGLEFTGDFYVAYIQAVAHPNAPGMATDENGQYRDRSWALVGGSWSKTAPADGNWMIRASVLYEVEPPVITSPEDDSYTNEPMLTVTGTSVADALITIYNDDVEVASGTAAANGQFAIEVELSEGMNLLTATATLPAGETRPSAVVKVTLDMDAPELTVTSPEEDAVTNREVLNVTGSAVDEHLAAVTVNGTEVAVDENGAFSHRMMLDVGENTIIVVATDRAGNSTTVERTVMMDNVAPIITNVMPNEDVTIPQGGSLTISFESEEGLEQVGYRIILAGSGPGAASNPNMTEVSPGRYEGTYTIPQGTTFTGATIQVWARDAAGNYSEANAAGKLSVGSGGGGTDPDPGNQAPKAVWSAPKNPKVNQNLTFDGRKSSDPDGTIVSHVWTIKDSGGITVATLEGARVTYKFTARGVYTVTLTVTDNKGAMGHQTETLDVK